MAELLFGMVEPSANVEHLTVLMCGGWGHGEFTDVTIPLGHKWFAYDGPGSVSALYELQPETPGDPFRTAWWVDGQHSP